MFNYKADICLKKRNKAHLSSHVIFIDSTVPQCRYTSPEMIANIPLDKPVFTVPYSICKISSKIIGLFALPFNSACFPRCNAAVAPSRLFYKRHLLRGYCNYQKDFVLFISNKRLSKVCYRIFMENNKRNTGFE